MSIVRVVHPRGVRIPFRVGDEPDELVVEPRGQLGVGRPGGTVRRDRGDDDPESARGWEKPR
jgi:hypothetical protein